MTKTEQIVKFLQKLKILHKTGEEGFEITCNHCGSNDCQVMVFPDVWNEKVGPTQNLLGLKCVGCGFAGSLPFIESSLYG